MAAIENIIAWAKHEQARLALQLEELQAGRLRTYEKHDQFPGWLEVDTTEHTIELNRHYISELNAIVAGYPEVEPTAPAAPPPAPRFVPPARDTVVIREEVAEQPPRNLMNMQPRPDWIEGWGVVKGQPPRWSISGIYAGHAEANLAAAEAGDGYYARYGSYNFGSHEFSSGTNFERL